MTIEQFLQWAGSQALWLAAFFTALPLAAWAVNAMARDAADRGPWKYLYSGLVYLCCVPGMFAAAITVYSLFLLRANLLRVNVLVYFLPVASMIATLVVIGRAIRFEKIPGSGRLSGLMILLGISFLIVFLLDRFRVVAFFGGTIQWLTGAALALFGLLKLGLRRMQGNADEPAQSEKSA